MIMYPLAGMVNAPAPPLAMSEAKEVPKKAAQDARLESFKQGGVKQSGGGHSEQSGQGLQC